MATPSLGKLDRPLLLALLALLAFGVFSIASATMEEGGKPWKTQVLWIAIAGALAVVVYTIDYRVWAGIATLLHGIVIALLGATLFLGTEVGGNRSWLDFGPARLQPSELAKWTTCLVVAVYLARRSRETLGLVQLAVLGLIVGLPVALIAMQPDHGTALIFGPIYLAAVLIGGVRWRWMVGLLLVALALTPVAWQQLKPYQKERILNVLEPGRDPSGTGYQTRQSKIAIGSGGIVGKGPFRGTQSQLNFLPAQHTDFILAVVAEELGFVGTGALIVAFWMLLYRGIKIAGDAQDRLGTYLCLLVVAWLVGQMTINIGMVLGRLPTIGVPLPFVSYGGSALVASLCGVALLLNVRAHRLVN